MTSPELEALYDEYDALMTLEQMDAWLNSTVVERDMWMKRRIEILQKIVAIAGQGDLRRTIGYLKRADG